MCEANVMIKSLVSASMKTASVEEILVSFRYALVLFIVVKVLLEEVLHSSELQSSFQLCHGALVGTRYSQL